MLLNGEGGRPVSLSALTSAIALTLALSGSTGWWEVLKVRLLEQKTEKQKA
jgi:hypothetical protein